MVSDLAGDCPRRIVCMGAGRIMVFTNLEPAAGCR